jgi:UDP-N-acetylmuramoyl-L-alanyl-D-glutamate--2,6-diaminopimelate ligase
MTIRKIVKAVIPQGLFEKVEPAGHLVEAVFWNVLYGFPGHGMKVIGVTGTNGKTTTTYLIHHMLVEAGYNAGLMTTVAYGVGKDIKQQMHHYTNVPVRELMQRLRWMRAQGMDWLVLETTSQALVQHRTWGVPYSVAVLTNITHEHLDYHKTFERYVAAKRRLFELTERNKTGLQVGITNADDPNGRSFAAVTERPVLYGVGQGDVRAVDVELSKSGIRYRAETSDETYHIESTLAGSFNVSNTLAAVCVGRTLGLNKEQIEQGIASLRSVEGRMVTVDEGQPFGVIIDYAHTPDSFEKLFKDLRPATKGKLIVMFGSAGRRDEAKRTEQGRLAAEYADEVVLTEEDDRDCDGLAILEDIAAGAEKAGKKRGENLFLVHNRTEAIAFALSRASSPDDLVLLLGKGHEKTIEREDREDPWDELGTTKDALRNLLSK